MVVSLPYPPCSTTCYDIMMEFKVISRVLCCPDTAIVGTVDQAITHSVMMARSTFSIPKNNRVLTVIKNAMIQNEPIAIGNSRHTHREQISIPRKQALCYKQVVQVLTVAPDRI